MRGIDEEANALLERAEEARAIAASLTDPVGRETMFGLADGYENAAKQLFAGWISTPRRAPGYWHRQAESARGLAAKTFDFKLRQQMLGRAARYEQLAQLAEGRDPTADQS
jgi:hypothetical protein